MSTSMKISLPAKTKQELLEKYELKETLGTGAFSEVKKAVDKQTGVEYAVKIIDRQKCIGKENMIQTEIRILQRVRHDNIIQLYDLYESSSKIYLIMELVTGGELFESIIARGYYTEQDAAGIVQKILMAVDYLHDMGIAHRDLKPENLLFFSPKEGSKIMISDFGLSKIFNDEELLKTACGTPGYVAPEVLRRQGYGKEVDMWSLGVITYILLCGYPPFYDESNEKLFQQIMKGTFEFDSPHWDDISCEAKDFISRLMVVDARKRYTAKQALRHPFITLNCRCTKEAPIEPLQVQITEASESGNVLKKSTPSNTNLAQRVSMNLRSRGASISRRRSVDPSGGKSPRVSPYIPTHSAPAPPVNNAQKQQQQQEVIVEEEAIIEVKDFEPSNPDSGLGSQEVNQPEQLQQQETKRNTLGKMSEETFAFLKRLSEVNNLIEANDANGALKKLQESKCPQQVINLYEEMIITLDAQQISSQDQADINEQQTMRQKLKNIRNTVMEKAKLAIDHVSETTRAISSNRMSHSLTSMRVSEDKLERGGQKELPQLPKNQAKILSLDLHILPPGIKSNHTSNHKNKRLRHFINTILPNFDVIMLQECFTTGTKRVDKLIKKAIQAGFVSWVASSQLKVDDSKKSKMETSASSHNFNGSSVAASLIESAKFDGGLMILSKFKIVKSTKFNFSKAAGADRMYSKGVLYAKIELEQGVSYLHVFDTHLQQPTHTSQMYQYNPADSTTFTRHTQLKELKEFIDQQLLTTETSETNIKNDLKNIIVISGNLNVNGRRFNEPTKHSNEYIVMKKILEDGWTNQTVCDVLYERCGEHPITYGNVDTEGNATETVLTELSMQRVCASMDYLMEIIPIGDHACLNDVKIEKFAIDNSTVSPENDRDDGPNSATNSNDTLNAASSTTLNFDSSNSPYGEIVIDDDGNHFVDIELKTIKNGVWENPVQTDSALLATDMNSAKSPGVIEEKLNKVLAFLANAAAGGNKSQPSQLSDHYGISAVISLSNQ